MRSEKNYRTDQETIIRFLDVLGGAIAILSGNKTAGPGFFIIAHSFIQGFIDEGFFKKEELLIRALEDNGFPVDDGPVGLMREEQTKSRDAAAHMLSASKGWKDGDEEARGEVVWAASEYTSTMRGHLDRLKTRIFPLLEQNISPEDEHKIAEGLNAIAFENSLKGDADKYSKLIESLEEELSDWK
jgi:hemerythrin-like domain-containing protein